MAKQQLPTKIPSKYSYTLDKNSELLLVTGRTERALLSIESLNIGDPLHPPEAVECLAAVFDLEGFTRFSNVPNPKNTVTPFLNEFFVWLFGTLEEELTVKATPKRIELYAELPFFCKFLGDGVLLLFSTSVAELKKRNKALSAKEADSVKREVHGNLIIALDNVCKSYQKFYASNTQNFNDLPTRLRCGAAHGDVLTFGSDYVGPCVNLASRLHDLHGLTFAFAAANFDPKTSLDGVHAKRFKKVSTSVRGGHVTELVYVRTAEYDTLSAKVRGYFGQPGETPNAAQGRRK